MRKLLDSCFLILFVFGLSLFLDPRDNVIKRVVQNCGFDYFLRILWPVILKNKSTTVIQKLQENHDILNYMIEVPIGKFEHVENSLSGYFAKDSVLVLQFLRGA